MGDSDKSVTAPTSGSADMEIDALGYLTRSNLRVDALLTIQSAGTIEERELREQYDAARTTVTRTLDGFEDRGWVTRNAGACTLTAYGDAVAATVADAVTDVDTATSLAPFLRRVPATAFDLDPTTLAGAEVTVAEPGSPYAPVEEVTTLRQQSSTVRELSSIVARDSAEQVHDRAVAGDASFEIVLQADVVDQIQASDTYREQFERTVEQAAVDVRVYAGEFPFLIVLLDDVVALGVSNEEEMPAALVVSDAAAARSWAERRYQTYYDDARPYTDHVDDRGLDD